MPPKAKKPASIAKKPSSKAKPSSHAAGKKRAHSSDSESDTAGSPSKKSKNNDDDQDTVTVLKRGAAPVDPHSAYIVTHRVYEDYGEVWDAMLNQTNISGNTNSNKFYVIQLLQKIGGPDECILFTRWGRVGENGAKQEKGPWASALAISQFKKQFKSKTGTEWEQRHGAMAKKGKYTWLERDFEDDAEDVAKPVAREKTPESTLCTELQDLCRLIFSASLLSAHLSSMNYDAKKLPLGKLSKATILRGFTVLKQLADTLQNPTPDDHATGLNAVWADLSSQYYSIIPHNFGRNRPIVFNNMELLKTELEILDALGKMEVAQQIISASIPTDENGNAMNPLDAHFKSLNISSMSPVARASKEFAGLQDYVEETHGYTHAHIRPEILNVFRVERAEEAEAFSKGGYDKLADGERMLLWHGSRTTNFAGILKQGLRIAPPEAPVSGYMFGKGIYLADVVTKSAGFCHAYLSNGVGLLLLCEAAVKPFHELKTADFSADEGCKAAKALATKGIGITQPTEWQDAGVTLDRPELAGVHMPKGGLRDVGILECVQYNEYIVYSKSQIRLRYLLMVKMD